MARKEVTWTATHGRDAGKAFKLTEMPAMAAEKWAIRAFLALARGGVDIPEDVTELGLAGIAQIGFKALAGARYEDAEPLLDEMMGCVRAVSSKGHERALVEEDIEEAVTLLQLRREVFNLHVGFSPPAGS